jgi:hypothetical protein
MNDYLNINDIITKKIFCEIVNQDICLLVISTNIFLKDTFQISSMLTKHLNNDIQIAAHNNKVLPFLLVMPSYISEFQNLVPILDAKGMTVSLASSLISGTLDFVETSDIIFVESLDYHNEIIDMNEALKQKFESLPKHVSTICPARIGFMGNPSDGFNGRTLSFLIDNFCAQVDIIEHAHKNIEICINHELDPLSFDSLDSPIKLIIVLMEIFFNTSIWDAFTIPLPYNLDVMKEKFPGNSDM